MVDSSRRKFVTFVASAAGLSLAPSFVGAAEESFALASSKARPKPVAGQRAFVVFTPGEELKILDERDIDVCIHPASITKLALAACYFEFKNKAVFSASEEEMIAVERQLSNALITSHNGDATQVAAFISRQCIPELQGVSCANTTAEYRFTREILPPFFEDLGMISTHFFNSSGNPGRITRTLDNRTTVRDLSILVNFLMQNYANEVLAITSRPYFNERLRWGKNTNPLLPESPRDYAVPYVGVDGLKTGYIDDSGYNLVATAVRKGQRAVIIDIGATSRKESAVHGKNLFDFAFDSIQNNLELNI